MATSYKTPGVYVQEISTLPASVAPVETAIPCFIGATEKAEKDGNSTALKNIPTRITSMLEYKQIFGGPNDEGAAIAVSIADTVSGSTITGRTISTSVTAASVSRFKMYYALQMYFANGGGPCWIISIGTYSDIASAAAHKSAVVDTAIPALQKVDEPTIICIPDKNTRANYKDIYDTALAQCNKLMDRVLLMDLWDAAGTSPYTDATNFRDSGVSADNLKYGMAYYPELETTLSYGYADASISITHTGGSAVYNGKKLSDVALAEPNLYRQIQGKIAENFVKMQPSSAIAGIYAKVDRDRGVWKAPANVSVSRISGPSVKITNQDQENLNVDPTSGKSINCIRTFAGKGTLVWGARTLAGNDNEWRYVNVRRFYNFVEESVKKATEFVVFEPNDANTWLRTKTMIENFLISLWRQGALQGAKPEDAFFVRVGLGQTMTSDDILNGYMNVEIGMAVVRPAEFIILKFSHLLQKS
ncbi:MAG: phage tail sheath family protein [Bacteroidetes bacterium]|nr:phage tail sheath family protein [Bacteroidota bacterium]